MTPAKRAVLAKLMRNFVELCQQAIVVNKVRVGDRRAPLTQTYRSGYHHCEASEIPADV
jgi:hypothetical protein